MKIGLDLDDVTVDFFQALLNYYNKKYERNDKPNDFKEFKWWPVWRISREEAIRRVDEFHETHNIKDIKPIEGAIDSVNKLIEYNELFIITSRPIRFKSKVESWIKHHLNKEIKVIHAGDFHKGQSATKAEICKELGIEIMIEDAGETASDCAENGTKVLLFDKSWNKKVEHKNITRVKNWKEVLKIIKNFK